MADLLGTELELPTLREYAKRYFVWGECPHIRRMLEENGHCTERHERIQRGRLGGRLENHVLNDSFVEKRLSDIKRADLSDLRSRLNTRCSSATANKVIDVVKIIIREAVIREELSHDPTDLVKRMKYKQCSRGIFSIDELKKLFPGHG